MSRIKSKHQLRSADQIKDWSALLTPTNNRIIPLQATMSHNVQRKMTGIPQMFGSNAVTK